jgi:exosome complex RNA-binding protein Csl4
MRRDSVRQLTAAIAATLALVVAPLAWSHEGHDHSKGGGSSVMGTVTAVHKDVNHVEVKAKDGQTTGFKVDEKTKYMRGTTAAKLDDIKVGDRVVATVTGQGENTTATVVKLSKGAAAAAAKTDTKAPASTQGRETHKH